MKGNVLNVVPILAEIFMYINHAPLIQAITLQQKFGEALKQRELPGPYFSHGKLSNSSIFRGYIDRLKAQTKWKLYKISLWMFDCFKWLTTSCYSQFNNCAHTSTTSPNLITFKNVHSYLYQKGRRPCVIYDVVAEVVYLTTCTNQCRHNLYSN